MSSRKLVIVGTGGTSVDIFDAVLAQRAAGDASFEPFCFLDDNPSRIGQALHGLPVKGPLELAREMADCVFINGIGSPGNFWRRDEFVRRLGVAPDRFATIVHPTASVSSMADVGPGTAILQHVTISANARIGSPRRDPAQHGREPRLHRRRLHLHHRRRVSVRQRGRRGVLLSWLELHGDWWTAHPRQIARRHGVGRARGRSVQLGRRGQPCQVPARGPRRRKSRAEGARAVDHLPPDATIHRRSRENSRVYLGQVPSEANVS